MTPEMQCSYSTISSRELLNKLLPLYSIDTPLECELWEHGANDTYQVRCANERYFLRVYRCGAYPREANEFEAEALAYLQQQGLPVAFPIAKKSGGYLSEILAPEGIRVVLLSALAEGTTPNYSSLENCRLAGESVAQLHHASRGFQSKHQRTHLDLQWLLEASVTSIREFISHQPDALKLIEQVADKTRVAVKAVPEDSLDFGICHGDLHGGNMHTHDGQITHFDFEECAFGYRVYDLATFKWGTCRGEKRAEHWRVFIEGYKSVRPLSEINFSMVNTFVIIRELCETAYGIRHVEYFGHNGIMAADIDDMCERLKDFANV